MSAHYGEDELILYYYGEGRQRGDVKRHLGECEQCASAYRDLSATMQLVVAPDAPARGEQYGAEVWQRIRHRLPERESRWSRLFGWDRLAMLGAAAAFVLVVGAAFTAGRLWPNAAPPAADVASNVAHDADARARVAAIADHLERSERLLLDVVNAEGGESHHIDLSAAQEWASDLIEANRLYRTAALRGGDGLVADVLDDLERNLLEIVHGPSTPTAGELNELRMRIDAVALLFRVRVLQEELREREVAPPSSTNNRQRT